MRIRVCRSGVSGMVYQKILHLSTCYTISQFSGIPGFSVDHCMQIYGVVPFCQMWSRALPERASIAVEWV